MIVLPVGYRVVNKHPSEIDFINPKMINYFFFYKIRLFTNARSKCCTFKSVYFITNLESSIEDKI